MSDTGLDMQNTQGGGTPYGPSRALEITHIQTANVATGSDGSVMIHSPVPVLVVLLSAEATLVPDDISLPPDTVILIPPAYPCQLHAGESLAIEVAVLEFNFRYQEIDVTMALPTVPTVIPADAGEGLIEDVCTLCNSASEDLGVRQTALRLVSGYRIATILAAAFDVDSNPVMTQGQDPHLPILIRYLQENYQLPLTIDDIAAECRVSPRQIFNVSRRLGSKVTPMRLLKKIRLEHSLDLLRREDIGIGKIAGMVGFADSKNFSKEFKRHYGMSPKQYRQQSYVGAKSADLVKDAEACLKESNPQRASALYLKAIESAPSLTNIDELYYKAGLALRQAGDFDVADQYWNKVTTLRSRLLINLAQCEYHSKSMQSQRVVDDLRHIYRYADEELRLTAVECLSDWMLQCANEDEPEAATNYAAFAKELVGAYPLLKPNLSRTLNAIGEFEESIRLCPNQGLYAAAALRAAGLLQEHLDRFPKMRRQCAICLWRMGRFEEILRDYADMPAACVQALVHLGRAEEAAERYPEHNTYALFKLGRYDEILANSPDDLESCMWALVLSGRIDEALEFVAEKPDQLARLLIHLERPKEILESTLFERAYQIDAIVLRAVHLLERKQYSRAIEMFEGIRPMTEKHSYFSQGFYERELMIPVIRHLYPDAAAELPASRWPEWRTHFRAVIKGFRYKYAQSHWYDMRFVLSEINEKEYLKRPLAVNAPADLNFAKALKAELRAKPAQAAKWYRAFLAETTCAEYPRYDDSSWSVKNAYIRWRLGEAAAFA